MHCIWTITFCADCQETLRQTNQQILTREILFDVWFIWKWVVSCQMRLLRSHFPHPLTIVNCNDNNWVESDYLLLGKINFYHLVDICFGLWTKSKIDRLHLRKGRAMDRCQNYQSKTHKYTYLLLEWKWFSIMNGKQPESAHIIW